MTVIVTAVAADLDADLDLRFGRAACFLVVDPETLAWEAQANPAVNATGGAGVQAAQTIAQAGPEAVISGAFGPNAFQALQAAGIKMYRAPQSGTARQAVEDYRAGRLTAIEAPTARGRHG
jgi:predicted Fe-Mo cluster-binding NifX family protein